MHLPAEAVALAKGLGEKQLSLDAPHAPAVVREAYAARLWLCLALQRRVLGEWVGAIGAALPHAFADGALLRTPDEAELLVDLLAPLALVGGRSS